MGAVGVAEFLSCMHIKRHILEKRHCERVITEEVVDVGHEETPVPIVCHVTSVVDPGDEILEGVPWCILILIKVNYSTNSRKPA